MHTYMHCHNHEDKSKVIKQSKKISLHAYRNAYKKYVYTRAQHIYTRIQLYDHGAGSYVFHVQYITH